MIYIGLVGGGASKPAGPIPQSLESAPTDAEMISLAADIEPSLILNPVTPNLTNRDLESRRLCIACIGEPVLVAQVIKHGLMATCDYCGRTEASETLAELATCFEGMFERHFEIENDAYSVHYGPRGDAPAEIIANTGLIDEEPSNDIRSVMAKRYASWSSIEIGEPTEYDEELSYVAKAPDDADLRVAWATLEKELSTRHRFFSVAAETGFALLFNDIASLTTDDGRPVVREIGPCSDLNALFRARAFESRGRFEEALIDPERYVGTPAAEFAKSGRMNPLGVAVFYGATTEALALVEVRPPVGSRVITGRFALQRTLRVLDVDALESILADGSRFDPTFAKKQALGAYLSLLAKRIRMPVMPSDEATDYLVTQAMADYLAARLAPPLNGIAYSSAQGVEGAVNVALFNEAARVRAAVVIPAATYSVSSFHLEEDVDDYRVWTRLDPDPPAPPPKQHDLLDSDQLPPEDDRPETLILDRNSIKVHRVKRVSVETQAVAVSRWSWTNGEIDF